MEEMVHSKLHKDLNEDAIERVIPVALVGSSGGGAATLGHTDPTDLLTQIRLQLRRVRGNNVQFDLAFCVFVSIHGGRGLDAIQQDVNLLDSTIATLYTVGCSTDEAPKQEMISSHKKFQVTPILTSNLREVNALCSKLDEEVIATSISKKNVAGLISISSDPKNINFASFNAAAQQGIPVTGSGGTSLSAAVALHGIDLVGNAGGSVATTTYTRAISYVYALANNWNTFQNNMHGITTKQFGWQTLLNGKITYAPFSVSKVKSLAMGDDMSVHQENQIHKPQIGSVLDSCLPAFVAVCMIVRVLESISDSTSNVEVLRRVLEWHALPTACCVTTANCFAPEHGSLTLMAASVASMGCGGSVVGGLLAGWLVSKLLGRVLFYVCIQNNIPATMTNILVGGGVGVLLAASMHLSGLASLLNTLTDTMRWILHEFAFDYTIGGVRWQGQGIGFLFGCLFSLGSKIGWYHSVYLPIILLEMERGKPSILGAVDELTLVLVSGGICLANLAVPVGDVNKTASISKRGLFINLLCGDFIEVAYPFMEQNLFINLVAYLASGISTEILFSASQRSLVLSSAYLPFCLSIYLADDWRRMTIACVAAMGMSFIGAVLGNSWCILRQKNYKEKKQ